MLIICAFKWCNTCKEKKMCGLHQKIFKRKGHDIPLNNV